MTVRPGNGNQEHHRDPTQTEAVDDLVARRLHGVAIYPFGLDSFALAAFYGLVHKDYQWCSRRQEGNQQTKQDLGSKPAMPNRAVENPVIVREVAFVSEPESAQG